MPSRKPGGDLVTHKLLSENPEQYRDAAIAGIRHLLGVADGEPAERAGRCNCGRASLSVWTSRAKALRRTTGRDRAGGG